MFQFAISNFPFLAEECKNDNFCQPSKLQSEEKLKQFCLELIEQLVIKNNIMDDGGDEKRSVPHLKMMIFCAKAEEINPPSATEATLWEKTKRRSKWTGSAGKMIFRNLEVETFSNLHFHLAILPKYDDKKDHNATLQSFHADSFQNNVRWTSTATTQGVNYII